MQILLSVGNILRDIFALLCRVIYSLIADLYELFINISSVKILQGDSIKIIYQRITLILSIVMVFYVTFQAISYLIQPNLVSDKEKGAGKIIQRLILVVVFIALVPQVFTWAYSLQNSIVKNQIFSKVILGRKSANVATYGRSFSASIFSMFYYVDTEYWKKDYPNIDDLTCEEAGNDTKCQTLVDVTLTRLAQEGTLDRLSFGLNSVKDHQDEAGQTTEEYCITFDMLLAVGVGGFVCWIILIYCVDAGVRVAQLTFLQLIAPIPIISYIVPKKDGMFEKWLKQCITTYIDLFLRMAIIYLVFLITEILTDAYRSGNLFVGLTGLSFGMKSKIYLALILGLLFFAKKAPKMLQELFPKMGEASGNFGIGVKAAKEKIATPIGNARRYAGGVTGFVAGLATGHSLKAGIEGARAGANKEDKGLIKGGLISRTKRASAAGGRVRQNRRDVRAAGGTTFGSEHLQEHYQNVAQKQDRRTRLLEEFVKQKKACSDQISGLKFMKALAAQDDAIKRLSPEAAAKWEVLKKDIEKLARQHAAGAINEETLRTKIVKIMNQFNYKEGDSTKGMNYGAIATLDTSNTGLEIGSANWRAVTTTIGEARRTAEELQRGNGGKYTITDADGKKRTIENKFDYADDKGKFAENMGTYADEAGALSGQIKASDEFREAHTNAQGSANNKK